MSRLKPRHATNLATKSLVCVWIVHQQHVQGAEAVAEADMATAKSVPDLGGRGGFRFFVVISEAKTSRVRNGAAHCRSGGNRLARRARPANYLRYRDKLTFRLKD
jgi:hypothetical protein